LAHTRHTATKADGRQQGRTGNTRLSVGLIHACNSCREIEISGLCLSDQVRELLRAEAAPPIG
jgi:hypothetical protein